MTNTCLNKLLRDDSGIVASIICFFQLAQNLKNVLPVWTPREKKWKNVGCRYPVFCFLIVWQTDTSVIPSALSIFVCYQI